VLCLCVVMLFSRRAEREFRRKSKILCSVVRFFKWLLRLDVIDARGKFSTGVLRFASAMNRAEVDSDGKRQGASEVCTTIGHLSRLKITARLSGRMRARR
jgi:hypothetical protein